MIGLRSWGRRPIKSVSGAGRPQKTIQTGTRGTGAALVIVYQFIGLLYVFNVFFPIAYSVMKTLASV